MTCIVLGVTRNKVFVSLLLHYDWSLLEGVKFFVTTRLSHLAKTAHKFPTTSLNLSVKIYVHDDLKCQILYVIFCLLVSVKHTKQAARHVVA
jgi:hypothetical protein